MKVQISPTVQINQLRAENNWLRETNLLQAQAIEDLKAELALQLADAAKQKWAAKAAEDAALAEAAALPEEKLQ